jgi:hypothetical protein
VSADEHGIYTNLRGTTCACGEAKLAGRSFCRKCYFSLPKAMRNALYQRAGYVEAFRAALKLLSLEEPKAARPQTLSDVFPIDRGPIRRNPYKKGLFRR